MPQDIKDVIIASVLPDIMHSLTSGIIKYLNIKPIIVSSLDQDRHSDRHEESERDRTGPDRRCGGRV